MEAEVNQLHRKETAGMVSVKEEWALVPTSKILGSVTLPRAPIVVTIRYLKTIRLQSSQPAAN